jgi:hypothetical protein
LKIKDERQDPAQFDSNLFITNHNAATIYKVRISLSVWTFVIPMIDRA